MQSVCEGFGVPPSQASISLDFDFWRTTQVFALQGRAA